MPTQALAAALALGATLAATGTCAAADPLRGTWSQTLQARDFNRDGTADAWYDTTLDVTWLADAKAIAGTAWDSTPFGSATDGRVTWQDARAWIDQLSVHGVTGWRLPKAIDLGDAGCTTFAGECYYDYPTVGPDGRALNEWAHLYRVTLGNLPLCDKRGRCLRDGSHGLQNTGPFVNLARDFYWTQVERDGSVSPYGRFFDANYGHVNDDLFDDEQFLALAVRDGDVVTAVPEPGTGALLVAGLLGLWRRSRARRLPRVGA